MTSLSRGFPGISGLLTVPAAILLLGTTASDLCAQSRLSSDPPGVHISLDGPISVAGYTPIPFDQLTPGRYKLRSQGMGTTWVRGSITFMLDGEIKAGTEPYAYSLLAPPGLIHLTQKETVRGLFFLGMGIGSISQVIINETNRQSASRDVEQAEEVLSRAVSEEAIIRASNLLEAAGDVENDAAEMKTLWAIYLGSAWIGAALETWLFTAQPKISKGPGSDYVLEVPRISGGAGALRSAFVPGSGQRHAGRHTRANFFLGGVALLGAGTLVAHEEYLDAKREQAIYQRAYDSAKNPGDLAQLGQALLSASDKTADADRTQLVLLGSTIGVYLWNILDAFILGNTVHRSSDLGFSTRPSSDLGFSIAPGAEGFQAVLSWDLP